MNKREFMSLNLHDRDEELHRACKAVDEALNLSGRETINELRAAAILGDSADEKLIKRMTKGSNSRKPACNQYLRTTRYWREAWERDWRT